MTHTATDRVLSTVELLESILLQLDLSTLLTSAQLVNRSWNELIAQSSRLQKTLFFEAEGSRICPSVPFAKLSPEDRNKRMEEKQPHPLLAKLLPPLFPMSDPGDNKDETTVEDQIVKLRNVDEPDIKDLPAWKKPGRREAFFRRDASWRRMYTHQPPLESMGLIEYTNAMGGNSFSYNIARCNGLEESTKCPRGGICMAALYDTIHSIVDESSSCFTLPVHQITSKQMEQCLDDICFGELSEGVVSIFKRAAAESELMICSRRTLSCVVVVGEEESEWEADFSSKDKVHFGYRAKGDLLRSRRFRGVLDSDSE